MQKTNKKYYKPIPNLLALSLFLFSVFISFFCSRETFAKDLSFTWSANPPPVEGYKLYYKRGGEAAAPYDCTDATNSNGDSPIDVGNVTEFTITGLDDTATYHFALTAYNGLEESDYTEAITVTGDGTPTNSSPTVTITNPSDSSSAETGSIVSFQATSFDNEQGDLSDSTEWFSSINGSLGTGQTISTNTLAVGSHTITASVIDNGGLTTSSSITISITEPVNKDLPPEVSITSPSSGSNFEIGDMVAFAATATDNEDGDLGQQLTWSSNLDGPIGFGSNISTSSLSSGTHTITASATDSNSQDGNDTISINITENTGNTAGDYLSNLGFQEYANQGGEGSVGIEEGGTTFSLTDNNWSKTDAVYDIAADTVLEFEFMSTREGEVHGIGFDEDNNIKNGKRIFALFGTENLRQNIQVESRYTTEDLGTWVHFTIPVGSYYTGQNMMLILANDNDKSASAGTSWFRNIVVTGQTGSGGESNDNSIPSLTISDPINDSTYTEGETITFSATAIDNEDGDLSNLITWNSSVDGQIGSDSRVSTSSLSLGSHIITASVTDSSSQHITETISINILDNTGNTTGGYLNNLSFQEYANQGGNGFVGIEDSGTTFSLTGNNWSNTDTVYNITADTVLEFEFMSTREGEVHGIGFDEDNNIKNGKRIFALFGTENLRQNIQVESRYTTEDLGTWVHFTLPVGSYYTGQDLRLVLANDNDKTAGTSWFRNIKLTE